jgi:phosphoribosylformylglycinamidine synthase
MTLSALRVAIIVFPGSNCDRDMMVAIEQLTSRRPALVWHKEASLDPADLVIIPGGFSFGDYLRCGAIAANSPICRSLVKFAKDGGYVLGICNGFQILTETGLLPGALMQNAGIKFLGKTVTLSVTTTDSAFTCKYRPQQEIDIPIAHHEGNYTVAAEELHALRQEDRIAFTYRDNPNGAIDNIAGVLSQNRRILGMMPHPERAIDDLMGPPDGKPFFAGLVTQFVSA